MITFLAVTARFARHSFAGSLLLVALQRTPMLRLLSSVTQPLALAPAAHVLRASAWLAASLGVVDALAGATQFVQNPTNPVTGTVGAALSVTFTINGAPTPVRSFRITGSLPPGLTMSGLSNSIVNSANPVVAGIPTQAGAFSFQAMGYDALNATGHTDRVNYTVSFAIAEAPVAAVAPTITTSPASQSVTVGASTTLRVVAGGTTPLTYQWRKNGVAIAGATDASLALPSVTLAAAGNYSVVVSNATGTVTSGETYVTIEATSPPSTATRLGNLSVRMPVGAGAPLIAGFVATGTAPKKVLIRAAGPALAALGVPGTLVDPQLELYSGAAKIHQSDNWDPALASVFAATGAFAFPAGSKDAALLITLEPGPYTAQVRGAGTTAGEVLLEVYEVP